MKRGGIREETSQKGCGLSFIPRGSEKNNGFELNFGKKEAFSTLMRPGKKEGNLPKGETS